MSDDMADLKGDIAFLKMLTNDRGHSMRRDGAMLVAVGVVFGLVSFLYWLIFNRLLSVPKEWEQAPWIAGAFTLILTSFIVLRRLPPPASAASRAMGAAWNATGTGITVAVLALGLGAWRLNLPHLTIWVFPVVLFTLYGTAWGVTFAALRRPWFAVVAAGCLAAALLSGVLMGDPGEWLVLSFGLFLLVAVPGGVILRRSPES